MTKTVSGDDEPLSRPPMGALMCCLLALALLIAVYISSHGVSPAAAPASQVRIRNDTPFPFHRVVVNGQPYGAIAAGAASAYRTLPVAYRYASIELVAGTRLMRLIPEDYTGEQPLGRGRFTYALRIAGSDQIALVLEKDGQ